MENKEIYIDDVDVSGCIYFKMNNKTPMCRACNSGVGSPYCEYHKDCYYKQLKEKEKECEELEKLYKELQDDMLACNKCRATIKLQQQLDQLKAENKKLKKDRINIIKENAKDYRKLQQAEQKLERIKEIAEKIDDSDGCAYGDYDCNNCSSLEQETVCTYKVKKLILQKISECEVE